MGLRNSSFTLNPVGTMAKELSEIRSDSYRNKMSTDIGNCMICGRQLESRPDQFVHLHAGGTVIIRPEEQKEYDEEHPGGDLGLHPVGPTCAKDRKDLEEYFQEV